MNCLTRWSADRTKVADSKTWLKKRRPEVLGLFEEVWTLPRKRKRCASGSRGRRRSPWREGNAPAGRDPSGQREKSPGGQPFAILAAKGRGPVPGFLTINFMGNHSVHADPAIRIPTSWVRNGTGSRITKQPPMAGFPGLALGN